MLTGRELRFSLSNPGGASPFNLLPKHIFRRFIEIVVSEESNSDYKQENVDS